MNSPVHVSPGSISRKSLALFCGSSSIDGAGIGAGHPEGPQVAAIGHERVRARGRAHVELGPRRGERVVAGENDGLVPAARNDHRVLVIESSEDRDLGVGTGLRVDPDAVACLAVRRDRWVRPVRRPGRHVDDVVRLLVDEERVAGESLIRAGHEGRAEPDESGRRGKDLIELRELHRLEVQPRSLDGRVLEVGEGRLRTCRIRVERDVRLLERDVDVDVAFALADGHDSKTIRNALEGHAVEGIPGVDQRDHRAAGCGGGERDVLEVRIRISGSAEGGCRQGDGEHRCDRQCGHGSPASAA